MTHIRSSLATAFLVLTFANAHALDEAEVRALEARCEAAREARLKPLREAKIAECQADKRNDPAYCERFWSDLGGAVRLPNGRTLPGLFYDLPECTEADEARRKLRMGAE